MIKNLVEKALGYNTIIIDGEEIKVQAPTGYIIQYQKDTTKARDAKNIDKLIDIQYDLVKTVIKTANPDITDEEFDILLNTYSTELLNAVVNLFISDKKAKEIKQAHKAKN